jgi:hypothetical protein
MRFSKLYKNIPTYIKPSQPTKVTYVGEFDANFSMTLRERKSPIIIVMQEDEIYIKGNMITSGNMKKKNIRKKRKRRGMTMVFLIQK